MSCRILAIDDSKTIRNLLMATLTNAGHMVSLAVDGQDGLDQFSKSDPDVVITDINMPNLDGFEFISAARSLKRERIVPILVLTTETSSELRKRARANGATGWLVKPFNDEELLKVISRVTSVRGDAI
ncbi:response regulator [Roseobacteraceae bacterium S113]